MNNLQVFKYEDTTVRTIEIDGETWWVLKDVCDVLELGTPARVAERLDDDEKGMTFIHTLGGIQEVTVINESGLYHVILRSNKPKAKPFRRWVTNEVLPSIRKTGSYSMRDNAHFPPKSTSVGEVASIIKTLQGVMKHQNSHPVKIAVMAEGICRQFGINIPKDFVEPAPWEQLELAE